MSYDLMVFDPAVAPRDRAKFLSWYKTQCEWNEPHDYRTPDVSTPALRKWFREISRAFPPLNGPSISAPPDGPKATDYSIGQAMIYAAFSWSEAETAFPLVKEQAGRHQIGFFDASSEFGDIWWPLPGWKFSCEARGEIPPPLSLEFGAVLNTLDPKENSFLLLENNRGAYMQCGGSKTACTVELRICGPRRRFKHYVIGHAGGSTQAASVKMSGGVVDIEQGQVFTSAEAAELFGHFFAGEDFPEKFARYEKDI